ncbi:MAG: hypothetical protein GQ583_12560 [Methyloprofundus sp.]|nr:hypothetical protein [Methyloprofundus sp.]
MKKIRGCIQSLTYLLISGVSLLCSFQLQAAVSDVTVTDVTTRAFSVVWVSDETITSADVHIYSDASRETEVSGMLNINLVSPAVALANGIAKIDVTGLIANTKYYIDTETTGTISGQVMFPLPESLPFEVKTAVSTTRENSESGIIVNDLIQYEIFEPDGATESQGTLMMLKIPGLSAYPVTAFVGDGFSIPKAVVDLNNIFDATRHKNTAVEGGLVMEISEFRGLLCDMQYQKRSSLRRVPSHEETPHISQLEVPDPCFSPSGVAADFDCNGVIDPNDFTQFLMNFGIAQQSCQFKADFDLSADGVIDPNDFTQFLSVFGAVEQQ